MKITALAGGVGAARFLEGLIAIVPQEDITVISNVGDDEEFFGLHVSPDIDIVIYTLAGAIDNEKGWGLQGETFRTLESLRRFGYDTWFNLGDGDLATHVHRTQMLRDGATLSEATRSIVEGFGLTLTLLPVTDDRMRTVVETDAGDLAFQEYFVKRRTEDEVRAVRFDGADAARPAPGVLEAIATADVIAIAPSNPIVSIGPILAVPRVREALRAAKATVVAVSPIIGGKTVKGPADRMMASLGMEASATGVAAAYADFLDVLVIDEQDRELAEAVEAAGVRAVVTETIMRSIVEKSALAEMVLSAGARAAGEHMRVMRESSTVVVRRMQAANLEALQQSLPASSRVVEGESRTYHETRFVAQEQGSADYLIAWESGAPVGHVFVRWSADDPFLRERNIANPLVEALAVQPERQSRGIATALMMEAERLAAERGHSAIGLAVGIENRRARALYARLSYRDNADDEFRLTWTSMDAFGSEQPRSEICTYMVKELDQNESQLDPTS
jgi:LPPG:FO 2-phospho-L-lactate transferase